MYRITIAHTRQVESLTRREWVVGGPDDEHKAFDGVSRGYTPQIPEKIIETTKVFELELKDLNIHNVARAILDVTDTVNP